MATTAKGVVSLERALSKLGLASRSQARELILNGRVTVDGKPAADPSRRVVPEQITIEIDRVEQPRSSSTITIALHKPRGYVTTRSDPEGRPTIYDLLRDLPERVISAGRLDLASTGLLILTNDTQFANWLTDPANALPRVYLVTVRGELEQDTAAALIRGITIENDRLSATDVVVRKASKRETHLVITLTEGKNREIRRMIEAVGYEVTRLSRVQFGGLELGLLPPGKWRQLSVEELRAAFPGYAPRKRVPRPK